MSASRDWVTMSPEVQFAYSQFFVYDAELVSPACEWTERHTKQGFARRNRAIAIGTLLEFGAADLAVTFGAPTDVQSYERVLAVPLNIQGGALAIDGPEEEAGTRTISIPNGDYRVTIAQRAVDDGREEVKIWLEKLDVPLRRSELLVVDAGLDPSMPLLETANQP